MPTRSDFKISIDGTDVTANFGDVLISLEIENSDGGKTDKLSIVLDDADGQIVLPRTGADIVAQLINLDDGSAKTFVGKTDEPKSHGDREGGMHLSITAHSADLKGEGKHKKHKHKDGGTLKDTASEFGQDAGYTVMCDDEIGGVDRDYWSMSNESFFSWGQRMAAEMGATFKIQGSQAAFVSRNGSASVSGQALAIVTATKGDNLISHEMTPVVTRAEFASAKVRWYDDEAAMWMEEEESIDDGDGGS